MNTPCDHKAERAVLGGILLRPNRISDVQSVLSVEDFDHPKHRVLFQAMVDLDARSEPIDMLTIASRLRLLEGDFDWVGPYSVELLDQVVTAENIGHYATIVKDQSKRKTLIQCCREVAIQAGTDANPEDLAGELDEIIAKYRDEPQDVTKSLKNVLAGALKHLEARRNGELSGVPTGFSAIDRLLCGLSPDDLIVLAARPRMGKTALGMGILMNAAKLEIPGLMFSLEMGEIQLGDRSLAYAGRVSIPHLRSPKEMKSHEWINLVKGSDALKNLPLEFDFTADITLTQIKARSRRWARGKKTGIVLVDYVQLVETVEKKGGSREQEVAALSRGLKALAKQIHMPVVALAQLNRECDKREDKHPMLSDLRESGSLEQDAAAVLLLYRDEIYDPETEKKGIAEVIVAKNRHGQEGVAELKWFGEFTAFETLERRDWGNGMNDKEGSR